MWTGSVNSHVTQVKHGAGWGVFHLISSHYFTKQRLFYIVYLFFVLCKDPNQQCYLSWLQSTEVLVQICSQSIKTSVYQGWWNNCTS